MLSILLALQTLLIAPVSEKAITATTTEAAQVPTRELKHLPIKLLDVDKLIRDSAEKYKVSYTKLHRTLECESAGLKDPTIRGDGGKAVGFAQIRTDFHPDIPLASSTDPEFAVDFMAKNFAAGKARMWSCYSLLAARDWK